jgi:hypothetical protein
VETLQLQGRLRGSVILRGADFLAVKFDAPEIDAAKAKFRLAWHYRPINQTVIFLQFPSALADGKF